MERLTYILSIILITFSSCSFGQHTDSTRAIGGITRDSFYIIHENIPKSKLWGNSWYTSTSYNFSKTNELDLNIGRTYGLAECGGGGCVFTMRSWGAGYGLSARNGRTNQMAKAFWEYCLFYFPPISAGIRAEYIYDITNNSHYIRPSFGLSLLYVDLFYNYSFNISGTENIFRHGLTLRIKYFHHAKNWQKNKPSRC